jgi:hypothetical protein
MAILQYNRNGTNIQDNAKNKPAAPAAWGPRSAAIVIYQIRLQNKAGKFLSCPLSLRLLSTLFLNRGMQLQNLDRGGDDA